MLLKYIFLMFFTIAVARRGGGGRGGGGRRKSSSSKSRWASKPSSTKSGSSSTYNTNSGSYYGSKSKPKHFVPVPVIMDTPNVVEPLDSISAKQLPENQQVIIFDMGEESSGDQMFMNETRAEVRSGSGWWPSWLSDAVSETAHFVKNSWIISRNTVQEILYSSHDSSGPPPGYNYTLYENESSSMESKYGEREPEFETSIFEYISNKFGYGSNEPGILLWNPPMQDGNNSSNGNSTNVGIFEEINNIGDNIWINTVGKVVDIYQSANSTETIAALEEDGYLFTLFRIVTLDKFT